MPGKCDWDKQTRCVKSTMPLWRGVITLCDVCGDVLVPTCNYTPRNEPYTIDRCDRCECARAKYTVPHIKKRSQRKEYCALFDEDCRERARVKYGRHCYVCDKSESANGQRLSVHHVDMNKAQGCDGHKWKLVPLCRSCHSTSHHPTWQSRLEYLLNDHATNYVA